MINGRGGGVILEAISRKILRDITLSISFCISGTGGVIERSCHQPHWKELTHEEQDLVDLKISQHQEYAEASSRSFSDLLPWYILLSNSPTCLVVACKVTTISIASLWQDDNSWQQNIQIASFQFLNTTNKSPVTSFSSQGACFYNLNANMMT